MCKSKVLLSFANNKRITIDNSHGDDETKPFGSSTPKQTNGRRVEFTAMKE